MKAIYKKEFRNYFQSIIGWLFLFFFFGITGVYIYVDNILGGYPNFEVVLEPVGLVFCFIVPMITMRFMAEERKQKTDQLLLTSGVSVEKIILGKLLAGFSLLGIAMAGCCIVPLMLSFFGNVNFASAYSGILGFFLMGCAYISIGAFISCTTEHQVLAAIITYGVIFFTWIAEGVGSLFETDSNTAYVLISVLILLLAAVVHMLMKNFLITLVFAVITEGPLIAVKFIKPELLEGKAADVFGAFSLIGRIHNFLQGIFDLSAVVYFLTVTLLFGFLAVQAVKKRRWN